MNNFTFNISLSVLNHLGRNLYRSFITVLGEAISNSWDADADNVWIYLNREMNYLIIKDDGDGMTSDDFQNKFLKIGFSKRKEGETKTNKKRPFIGRKGIGKLALLSCASKISIISKAIGKDYIGGTIDNTGLDNAILDDLTPQEYPLGLVDQKLFENVKLNHTKGTIIYFENIKDGIKNTEQYLKQAIALFFRFSLIDNSFNIYFNDELISVENLSKLSDRTQFLWRINYINDPFLNSKILSSPSLKQSKKIESELSIKGFIASVNKPSDLKILTTDEKVNLDLFVNGRLREKDILKHIPSARIVESYLYGQIHFDVLDGDKDRFTSSREGVVSDDALFQELLSEIKKIIVGITEEWDIWRINNRNEGDSENKRITKRERKSRELYNVISDDFVPPPDSVNHDKIEDWVKKLGDDAQYNFASYGECFISENLLRNFIIDKKIEFSKEALEEISKMQKKEKINKETANLSIDIRQDSNVLSYLSMDDLANLADKSKDPLHLAALSRDAKEYKPLRDAMAHTALLTTIAKLRLTSTYENIKARVKNILMN